MRQKPVATTSHTNMPIQLLMLGIMPIAVASCPKIHPVQSAIAMTRKLKDMPSCTFSNPNCHPGFPTVNIKLERRNQDQTVTQSFNAQKPNKGYDKPGREQQQPGFQMKNAARETHQTSHKPCSQRGRFGVVAPACVHAMEPPAPL